MSEAYDIRAIIEVSSLHPINEGPPNTKNLLAQIQNFLNTYLRGANTYCNERS